jgi:16S rRNA (cytosine1402-N4)-methyltransferase
MIKQGHIPVLLREVMQCMAIRTNGLYLDCTFGCGGYSRAILESGGFVVAIDRDPSAEEHVERLASEFGRDRLRFFRGTFSSLLLLLQPLAAMNGNRSLRQFDGVCFDFGCSSPQLDNPARGFSFHSDGPLDMRMDTSQMLSAKDLVQYASVVELQRIFREFGEERHAGRIATAICDARQRKPIQTCRDLATIVSSVVAYSEPGKHPATRTFQGLRIAVNQELVEIERGLRTAGDHLLKPGGVLAAVSFHSLEDRIVKDVFRSWTRDGHAKLAFKGVVEPTAEEIAQNPRSRSAKLRACFMTDAFEGGG